MARRDVSKKQLVRWADQLAKGPLLGGLKRQTLLDLLKLAKPIPLTAGQVLMRQGDVGESAFLVVDGELDVVVETPVGEVSVATLGPRQIVGEIAVFSRLPRTATVKALSDGEVLELSAKAIGKVVAGHPKAALGLLSALGQRVAALNRPLASLTLAAQALERADLDIDAMNQLLGGEDTGPFAQTLRKLLLEMEGKQARQQEMRVAGRLQQSILPRRLDFAAAGAPFAVEALMRPSREIGGDFYDFFFTDEGRKAVLVVADVSGKGIPAALFMAVSRTLLRATVATTADIETAVSQANAQLEAENPECLFVTAFVAELDLADGTLRYVNAGHCDGYVLKASGRLDILPATAPAVALAPNPAFTPGQIRLEPGDRLVLISDGVTEAFSTDDELYGEDRLTDLLGDLIGRPAEAIVAAVDADVTTFAAGREQSDDITLLVLAAL